MSDLQLFRVDQGRARALQSETTPLEKQLQNLIEANLEEMFGIKFLASEFVTSNGGRMDTLGIDENGFPVIIEYKRTKSENVINQGLFYLDWLMDHKGSFSIEVMRGFGQEAVETIDWSAPRLICIAEDFTKYDEHAVNQMNRNIELVRYRRFGDELLLLELVNAVDARQAPTSGGTAHKSSSGKTVDEYLEQADVELRGVYDDLRDRILSLGDDVLEKHTKFYVAFRRLKNFACVEVRPATRAILVYVKVNPDTIDLREGFTRDVRKIGHFGTGDLEVKIKDQRSLQAAFPLIEQSYGAS